MVGCPILIGYHGGEARYALQAQLAFYMDIVQPTVVFVM